MLPVDRGLWAQLNPLLDELMDRPAEHRAERLAGLRAEDPVLAGHLAELLDGLDDLENDTFLQRGPRLPDPGTAGQRLGAYTLQRELGRGGMGSVWLARRTDGRYDGQVAIKLLAGHLLPGSAERFAREGSILARLDHPHIARLIDAGVSEGGQRYLVLEYIDGETIDRYCERMALDVTARVRLFLDVLAAVAHAHNRLILHRDIKPGNILVTHAGEVKLLDFGVAKLMDDATVPAAATELTQLAGRAYTPAYAAPEQVQDSDVTTATDVYALGVLLYGLLGGGHPTAVAGSTALEQLRAVVEAEPRRLSEAVGRQQGDGAAAAKKAKAIARELRGDLDNIVAKALKKAPGERYANAQLMAEDLRRYLAHEPVAARADAPGYVLAKFVRRHQAGVAASAVVVVALVVGIGVALWEASEARRQRLQAEGLIEFMLGDLRKKLQPVGRLDVLDAVGEKVLAYYAAQDAARLDADALGRRARALHLIGEMADKRGKLDDAQKVFQQAADSTAELLARAPGDAQRLFDQSQSEFWVGTAAFRRGRLGEAQAAFQRYLELAQRLRGLDPANVEWHSEEAHAHVNLGVLQIRAGRPDRALPALEQARSAWQGLAGSRPEFHWEIANALGWIAKAQEAQGRYDAAVESQLAKLAALRSVPEPGHNRRAQGVAANGHYELARLHLAQGQLELAASAALEAQRRYAALTALDPGNSEWQANHSLALAVLAQAWHAQGRAGAALESLQRAQALAAAWLNGEAAPANKWFVWLAGSLAVLHAQWRMGAEGAAAQTLARFVEQARTRAAAGAELGSEPEQILAQAELLLGDMQPAHSAAAAAHWRAAAERLRAGPAGQPDDPARLALLAHALWRLGEAGEAWALAERIERSPYRHPVYADLQQRLAMAPGGRAGASPPRTIR